MLSRAPGAGQTPKTNPKNPVSLPSGTQSVVLHIYFSFVDAGLPAAPSGQIDLPAVGGFAPSRLQGKFPPPGPPVPILGRFVIWVDLRENQNYKFGRVVGHILAPWGPRRAPGAPGTAPARKRAQIAPTFSPGDPSLSPIRGHVAFLGPTAKRSEDDSKI